VYLYIHVPFCQSRCIYCDFYVELAKYGGQAAYVDALCQQIQHHLAPLANTHHRIETVYFGGGTPSLLPAVSIDRILQTINRWVPLNPSAEITLEANPNAWANAPAYYRKVGVNRVSVGVQSLVDTELKRLSRNHTVTDVLTCLEDCKAGGFDNISVDLMYGIPNQTLASWQHTLQAITPLAPDLSHISFYGLHVEEATPLATLVQWPTHYPMPTDDDTVSMFEAGCVHFKQLGFQLYEFSNLAKPGRESRHNLNYWANNEYLGLGPGGYSFWQGQRFEGVRNLTAWLANPLLPEAEPYTPDEQEHWETALMVGLRLRQGLDIDELEARYGIDVAATCKPVWDKYPEFFWFKDRRFGLQAKAIPVSNTLLAAFLQD
jgi:oxygen-independent coproporphyrinogen III oxidase